MQLRFILLLLAALYLPVHAYGIPCDQALKLAPEDGEGGVGRNSQPSFFEKQLANLNSAGFKQVDQSNYYYRGGILVELKKDGSFQLFTSVVSDLTNPSNRLLDVQLDDNSYNPTTLLVYLEDYLGRLRRQSIRANSVSFSSDEHLRAELSNNGSDIQYVNLLTKSGFSQHQNNPSLYRLEIKSGNGKSKPIFAVVNDKGQIAQFYSTGLQVKKYIKPKTEIIGFRLGSGQYQDAISVIQLKNDKTKFEISDVSPNGRFSTVAFRQSEKKQEPVMEPKDLSYEERRTLFNGILLQTEHSKSGVMVKYADGTSDSFYYHTILDIQVYQNSNFINLRFSDEIHVSNDPLTDGVFLDELPDDEELFYFTDDETDSQKNGFSKPAMESPSENLPSQPTGERLISGVPTFIRVKDSYSMVLQSGSRKTEALDAQTAKTPVLILVVFDPPAEPVSFDLLGLNEHSETPEFAKLARYIQANYGKHNGVDQPDGSFFMPPDRPIIFNFYGNKITTSFPLQFESIEVKGNEFTINCSFGEQSKSLIVLRGTLNQLVPHELHTEVVINVSEFYIKSLIDSGENLPILTDSNFKVNFRIDAGHGFHEQ